MYSIDQPVDRSLEPSSASAPASYEYADNYSAYLRERRAHRARMPQPAMRAWTTEDQMRALAAQRRTMLAFYADLAARVRAAHAGWAPSAFLLRSIALRHPLSWADVERELAERAAS